MTCSNWDHILTECEKDIGKTYILNGDRRDPWYFFGLVHGADDYYYGMRSIIGGKLLLCSCVGNLSGHGFEEL